MHLQVLCGCALNVLMLLTCRGWPEISARSTFGEHVRNFRLAVMADYRRVFAHPASIFFERGIANLATKVCTRYLSADTLLAE